MMPPMMGGMPEYSMMKEVSATFASFAEEAAAVAGSTTSLI